MSRQVVQTLLIGVVLPLFAFTLQSLFWDAIRPFAWFLFFPTVFVCAWLGGMAGALVSTALSTALAWYFFIPPANSFALANPYMFGSIALFMAMGVLFGLSSERIRAANRKTAAALAEVRAANDRITQLYEKTRELDELKSQFFANVSHELRTPLTLLLGPLAKRLAAPGLAEPERRETEMMLRNARLLYRHVADLLDAAKVEAGGMALELARADLAGIVRGTAAHFESLARERAIDYGIDTPAALPAHADTEKLQRILLNLLSNAFKFTPDGGRIAVRLREAGERVAIEVEDSGPGIPAELREAVFERFRQIEGGAQRRRGGTGLGLAIVKEFAELHGGGVRVTEAPGGGSLFTVELPLVRAEAADLPAVADRLLEQQALDELAPASPPATTAVAAADAPLVLVVEDNPDMRAYIADCLAGRYRLVLAGDGQEGLALALAQTPDLILSDIMMPGLSGDHMVAELRRHAVLAEVPIVMLSAKVDEELRIRLLQEGVQDYLTKPFSTEELLARIGGLVAARRQSAAQLRASEARFEATFEQAAVGIALVAPDGRWLRVNRKLCEIVGYDCGELLAGRFQDVTHPDDLDADLGQVRRMLAGEIASYALEKRYLRKDGGAVWINLTVSLARQADGSPDYFIKVVEDISARKQADLALQESQGRLRLLAGVVERIAAVRDLPALMAVVRPAVRQLTGADGATLVLNEDGYCHYVDEDAIGPLWKGQRFPLESCISGWAMLHGEPAVIEDIYADPRIPHAAYRPTFVKSLAMVPVVRTRPVAAIGTYWATRHRASEEELELQQALADAMSIGLANIDLIQNLERRVAERTAELTAANHELDSFAYAVSHDLRAPLRAMSGFSQALAEDYGDRLDGEAGVYLDQIGIASRKMGELIDGLLVLSRSTRGELRRDLLDLSAMASAILAELAAGEPARRVAVVVEPGLAAVGDGRMIESVLRNLLGNAWKYTARAPAPMIEVKAECGPDGPCFSVVDNGAGFDMAHANRLFQPFQRLHRQEEFPGIGIGLATVQRIIHRHGGSIRAEGAPGQGAAFRFTLPGAGSMTNTTEEAAP